MALTTQQQARYDYLQNLVAIRIDEYTEGDTVPDVPMGDIPAELKHAARSVLVRLSRKPAVQLAVSISSPTLTQDTDRNATIIPLPSDYVSFISAKLNGWKRNVSYLIDENHPLYDDQMFATKRAIPERPVAAIIPYPNERGALELFPADDEATSIMYLPETEPYDLPAEYDDALTWKAVANMFVIMRQPGGQVQTVLGLFEAAMQELNSDNKAANE